MVRSVGWSKTDFFVSALIPLPYSHFWCLFTASGAINFLQIWKNGVMSVPENKEGDCLTD